MDHKTSLTHHIHAPASKVWAVITDIPGSAATLSAVDSIRMLTAGPYAEGTRWKEARTVPGRSATADMLVIRSEPPPPGQGGSRHGITTIRARQGNSSFTVRFALAERDGGTDLTLTFGAEMARLTRLGRNLMTMFGPAGMRLTGKVLARDLPEIAIRAKAH